MLILSFELQAYKNTYEIKNEVPCKLLDYIICLFVYGSYYRRKDVSTVQSNIRCYENV